MGAGNGDDWLIISRSKLEVSEIKAKMEELGFESDVAETQDPWEVEFCQTIPYPVGGRTVWGPKIGRMLSRLPFATTSTKDDPAGVALGLSAAVSHIPFLRDYVKRIIEIAQPTKAVADKHHVYSTVELEPAADTYAFVFQRYGLSADDLEQFNQLLSTVTVMGTYVNWMPLKRVAECDE